MMKKIRTLLTGASGSVGYETLKQLVALKDKFEITVFDLQNENSKKLLEKYKNDVTIIFGDITQKGHLVEACKDKDYVIHLAAIIPPKADINTSLADKINIGGTKNLVENLEEYSPDVFLAYSSSVSVYGDRVKNPDILTTDELKPSLGDHYATTKLAAEKIIQQSKLNWTIFRLSAIMGAGNHKITELMFHMPLNTSVEITTPEDTARAFVNAADKMEQLSKRIFNLGGGHKNRILYKDLLQRNFDIYGLGKLNFPKESFADKNFHCGYYKDGDELENILHFRKDTLETYFEKVKKSVQKFQRFITSLVSPFVKKGLVKKSEPYHAFKNKDKSMMERFFNL